MNAPPGSTKARTVSFYHRETGELTGTILQVTDDRNVEANTPADHIAIDLEGGPIDHLSQRIDLASGQVVDYQPPQPSSDHEWNATTKRWQLRQAVADALAARRTALIAIAALERSGVRALRELALGQPGAADRLKSIDEAIAAQRLKL
jgi:hypothetical protein